MSDYGKLAQLAADGRERNESARASAASAARSGADESLRDALGRYYGSPAKTRTTIAIVGCCVVVVTYLALAFAHDALVDRSVAHGATPGGFVRVTTALGAQWWIVPLSIVVAIAALVRRYVGKLPASKATVARERAWASSLPFTLVDDYFGVLSAQPDSSCRLVVELAWCGDDPGAKVVQDLLGLVDTDASVDLHESRTRITTKRIDCSTGASVSTGGNYKTMASNHRLVPYVHELVDKVLLPIHHSHPVARVMLARTS